MVRVKRRTNASRRRSRPPRAAVPAKRRRLGAGRLSSKAAAAAPPTGRQSRRGRKPRLRRRSQPRGHEAASLQAPIRLEGRREGASWRQEHPDGTPAELKAHLRRQWGLLAQQRQQPPEWRQIWKQAEAYGEGALEGAGVPGKFAPIPLQGSAAAVLAVPSGSASLPKVLESLALLPFDETVIVAGNASEPLLEAIRERSEGAVIAHYPFPLDADVGRALGAKLTGTDIVLLVDADDPVPAETLGRFLWECDGRLDVALPDRSSSKQLFHRRPSNQRWHEFLNMTLSRPDLKMNTMSMRPLALSRAALDAIGFADLAIPVKAHAAALTKRLKVGAVARLDGALPALEGEELRRAAGDHIEAWGAMMLSKGGRLGFADRYRNRQAVGGVVDDAFLDPHSDE